MDTIWAHAFLKSTSFCSLGKSLHCAFIVKKLFWDVADLHHFITNLDNFWIGDNQPTIPFESHSTYYKVNSSTSACMHLPYRRQAHCKHQYLQQHSTTLVPVVLSPIKRLGMYKASSSHSTRRRAPLVLILYCVFLSISCGGQFGECRGFCT